MKNHSIINRIFYALSGLLPFCFMAISCSDDMKTDSDSYFISELVPKYANNQDTLMIDIITDGKWFVEFESSFEDDDLAWVHPSDTEGTGSARLTVIMDANDRDERVLTVNVITDNETKSYYAKQDAGSRILGISDIRKKLAESLSRTDGSTVLTSTHNWFIKTIVAASGEEDGYMDGYLAVMDSLKPNSGLGMDISNITDYIPVMGDSILIPLRNAEFTVNDVLSFKIAEEKIGLLKKISVGEVTYNVIENAGQLHEYESMPVVIKQHFQASNVEQIGKSLYELDNTLLTCSLGDDLSQTVDIKIPATEGDKNVFLPSSAASEIKGFSAGSSLVVSAGFIKENMNVERIPAQNDPTSPVLGIPFIDGVIMKGTGLSATLNIPYSFGNSTEYTFTVESDIKNITVDTEGVTIENGKSGILVFLLEGDLPKDLSDEEVNLKISATPELPVISFTAPIQGLLPLKITDVSFVGEFLNAGEAVGESFIRLSYEDGYKRELVNLGGTVDGLALQDFSSINVEMGAGFIDIPITGTVGNIDTEYLFNISFEGYNDETMVILPENNKDLTLSVKVEDLRLAEWNFSTPSFYDSAAAGTDLLINDNTKMACCPYSTDELGLDNGGKPDNLAGIENGYSASGIPATILKENCNNQVCKASKWLSNIYNYMAFNADAKTESKIIFEIPLPSDYKGSDIELSMDFRPLSTSPKSWKIYCADVDGEIRNYDLMNITASNATPNIIEKVFPVMTDNSGNQTVRIILEPIEEVTGAAHNNMTFLMNKVTVKRYSTYGFSE